MALDAPPAVLPQVLQYVIFGSSRLNVAVDPTVLEPHAAQVVQKLIIRVVVAGV